MEGKKSIAFPTLGTGSLHFPTTVMAEMLASGCLTYCQKNEPKHIDRIYILVHKDDNNSNKGEEELVRIYIVICTFTNWCGMKN